MRVKEPPPESNTAGAFTAIPNQRPLLLQILNDKIKWFFAKSLFQ